MARSWLPSSSLGVEKVKASINLDALYILENNLIFVGVSQHGITKKRNLTQDFDQASQWWFDKEKKLTADVPK